jgi:hypothetical protein
MRPYIPQTDFHGIHYQRLTDPVPLLWRGSQRWETLPASQMRQRPSIYEIKRAVSSKRKLISLMHADRIICAVSISSLTVTNSRKRILLNVVPNAFPATKATATRDIGDNSVIEYVQVWPPVLLILSKK